ncbi:hypothetical protein H0H81_010768, partial [Sphagnurus paluster]
MAHDDPGLLWLTIPTVLIVSTYFVRKWYLARRLRLHGIGKGGALRGILYWLNTRCLRPSSLRSLQLENTTAAPGFQTSVRRVRITPEIAARIKRGEEVSPEEIARASAAADAEEQQAPRVNSLAGRGVEERGLGELASASASVGASAAAAGE